MFAWPQISRCKMSAGRTEIWELWKKTLWTRLKSSPQDTGALKNPFASDIVLRRAWADTIGAFCPLTNMLCCRGSSAHLEAKTECWTQFAAVPQVAASSIVNRPKTF